MRNPARVVGSAETASGISGAIHVARGKPLGRDSPLSVLEAPFPALQKQGVQVYPCTARTERSDWLQETHLPAGGRAGRCC